MTYLSVNTTYLERKVLKASFGELFKDQYNVERNHGTVFGAPTFDGGIILDGSNDYARYALTGHEFCCDKLSFLMEFYPDFSPGEDADRVFFETTSGNRYIAIKRNNSQNNVIIIRLNEVSLGVINEVDYAPYWVTGGRNQLVISAISGGTVLVKLNNNLVKSTALSWVSFTPPDLFIGASSAGSQLFKGKVTQFKVFRSALRDQEIADYWNNTTETLPAPIVDLPMFSGDHVPGDRTLDRSGNGYDADFGPGAAEPTKEVQRGYNLQNGDRLAIDKPAIGAQVATVSTRLREIAIDSSGSYLWDARRSGGVGYCLIDTGGNIVCSDGTPYVNGVQTSAVDLHDSVITVAGHTFNVTEGIDIGVRNNYSVATDLFADMLEFQMHPGTLTAVKTHKVYDEMRRFKPTNQANLCSETKPAQRARGARWACNFKNQLRVEALQGTVYGTPVIDNGVVLKGGSDHIRFQLVENEVGSEELSIDIEFYPYFAHDDGGDYYFFSTTSGKRYSLAKGNANRLILTLGETLTGLIVPEAAYGPYWLVGRRNVLTVRSISGNTDIELNGHNILNSPTLWTPKDPSELYIGTSHVFSLPFKGEITRLDVYDRKLTFEEHLDSWNQTTFTYMKDASLCLPMRAAQDDPNREVGPELLIDGYMEDYDTDAYTPIGTAALSKQFLNPYEGNLWLKVAGASGDRARQIALTAGKNYHTAGGFHGDGAAGAGFIYVGTTLAGSNTSTIWQDFDVYFTALSANFDLFLGGGGGAAGFDAITLRETESRTLDTSAYKNHAVLGPGVAAPTRILGSRGYRFSGGQYATIAETEGGSLDLSAGGTVFGAFTAYDVTTLAYLLNTAYSASNKFGLAVSGGQLLFRFVDGARSVSSSNGILAGEFYTFAIRYDGVTRPLMFVNGVQQTGTIGLTLVANTGGTVMGVRADLATNYLDGDVYEMYQTKKVLNLTQIADAHIRMRTGQQLT